MGGPVRGLAPSALGPPLVLVSPLGALHCPRECPRGLGPPATARLTCVSPQEAGPGDQGGRRAGWREGTHHAG